MCFRCPASTDLGLTSRVRRNEGLASQRRLRKVCAGQRHYVDSNLGESLAGDLQWTAGRQCSQRIETCVFTYGPVHPPHSCHESCAQTQRVVWATHLAYPAPIPVGRHEAFGDGFVWIVAGRPVKPCAPAAPQRTGALSMKVGSSPRSAAAGNIDRTQRKDGPSSANLSAANGFMHCWSTLRNTVVLFYAQHVSQQSAVLLYAQHVSQRSCRWQLVAGMFPRYRWQSSCRRYSRNSKGLLTGAHCHWCAIDFLQRVAVFARIVHRIVALRMPPPCDGQRGGDQQHLTKKEAGQ